jgi:hypothetical protein
MPTTRTMPTFDVYHVLALLRKEYEALNSAETEAYQRWQTLMHCSDAHIFYQGFLDAANRASGAWRAYKSVYDAIDQNLAWQEYWSTDPQEGP